MSTNFITNIENTPILYYVIRGGYADGSGYVGQSQKGGERIKEHIEGAYSNKSYVSGAANLIREHMCDGCFFAYFTEDTNFGLPETMDYFLGNKIDNDYYGHGSYSFGTQDLNTKQKLDLAEVLHIAYHRMHGGDLSLENIQAGGQGNFKIYYVFSEKEKQLVRDAFKEFNIQVSESKLNSMFNKFDVVKGDLAKNYTQITNPVEHLIIREILSQDVLNNIILTDEFKEYLATLYSDPRYFLALIRKSGSKGISHASRVKETSPKLEQFMQDKMQRIIDNIVSKLGKFNINVSFKNGTSGLDYDSFIRTISQMFQQKIKGKKFNSISDAIQAIFTTQKGEERKFTMTLRHTFFANIEIKTGKMEAPGIKYMQQDGNNRRAYRHDQENNTEFKNFIKQCSVQGFYQNYLQCKDENPKTLMTKMLETFTSNKVQIPYSQGETYYRNCMTIIQRAENNSLGFEEDSFDGERIRAHSKFSDSKNKTYNFLLDTAHIIQKIQESGEISQLIYY